MEPNDALVRFVRGMSRIDAHNRLMSLSDRAVALVMMCMDEGDSQYFLSLLSPTKAERVQEERRLLERLNVGFRQYLKTVEHALEVLKVPGRTANLKSYLRPNRR